MPPLSDEPGGMGSDIKDGLPMPSDRDNWDPYYLARTNGSVLGIAPVIPGVTDHLNCKADVCTYVCCGS